jgi:type II secretory pathway pseudopilin PulG
MGFLSKNAGKNRRGITLVEALIAIIILALTFVAMIGVFVIGRVSVTKARHHSQAMNHARAAMEQVMGDLAANPALPPGEIQNLNGTCAVTISNFVPGVKRVEVSVAWDDLSFGADQNVIEELATLVRE